MKKHLSSAMKKRLSSANADSRTEICLGNLSASSTRTQRSSHTRACARSSPLRTVSSYSFIPYAAYHSVVVFFNFAHPPSLFLSLQQNWASPSTLQYSSPHFSAGSSAQTIPTLLSRRAQVVSIYRFFLQQQRKVLTNSSNGHKTALRQLKTNKAKQAVCTSTVTLTRKFLQRKVSEVKVQNENFKQLNRN